MSTPAVRTQPPVPASAGTRPVPAVGVAARFSELLGQRRPAEPQVADVEPPVVADDVILGLAVAAPVTSDSEDEVGVAEDESERPEPEAAPAAVPQSPSILPDDRCRAAMREVALTIAGFCNDRAVMSSELWQVQMALRADVVPDTTLHLGLSPHWLTLRFCAADPVALDLLSRGQEALVQVLDNTLSRKREIAITFESP